MDDKLKNALDFANYAHVLHNQKKLIKQKFIDNCVHYYNAGKFSITQDLIVYCLTYKQKTCILLDDNNIPIKIDNLKEFTDAISQIYDKAKEQYFEEYKKLTSNKSVKGLLDE